ncbi:MAG: hypothetical protein IPP93_00200 [Chitinophagaceae bacterium]|nr:hypothetical protein [Chitinophagaceae bacterium]
MKKLVLAAVLAILCQPVLNAQDIPERKHDDFRPMEARHHKKPRPDMSALNLSAEQKENFQKLRTEHQQKLKEYRERMSALKKEQHEKMQSVLTSEQKEQLKKSREAQKVKTEEMMKKRAEKMKTDLNLTDDQSAKLDKTRKELGDKMKALRENKTLSEEQRQAQMKELMKSHRDNMKTILTPEQLQKMKEQHKRPHRPETNGERKPATI